ncbi:hypothetical protein [Nostoc sp.]|uniref:hypothetical protein n=1 Tax=Nostoc sp. TaxID=1180 RepID=UPI002FFBC16E
MGSRDDGDEAIQPLVETAIYRVSCLNRTVSGDKGDEGDGEVEPLSMNVEPFCSNVEPLSMNVEPFCSNVEPFCSKL